MQTRTILITAGAAVVAFAVAFGIGKAGSGGEAAADNAAPAAQTFKVSSAEVSVTAPKADLPALKPKPKPKPKATPTPAPPTSDTTPPSTDTTPPPVTGGEQPVTGGEQPVTGGEEPVSGGGEG